MIRYFCDICGRELKHQSPRFQVRKGEQPRYFDRPAVAQIAIVFMSANESIKYLCSNCIKDAVSGGEVDVPSPLPQVTARE